MCGIAGVINFGKAPITEEQISLLLTGNEHRGNDATGIALLQQDGNIHVVKQDCPAWEFVSEKKYLEFIGEFLKPQTRAAILHARGASCGSPRQEKNNHPIYAGVSAVIHNGSIKNDDTLFNEFKLERKADTDTDIIRAILDKWGFTEEAMRKLNRICGSVAGAAFHSDFPGKVLMLRSGAPMTLASTEDQLFFASEKNTLHRAARPWVERFGHWFQVQRPDLAFSPMADHTAWILDLDTQKKWHGEFRSQGGPYIEPFRKTYEEYQSRQEKWDGIARHHFGRVKETIRIDVNGMKQAWCEKCQKEWAIPGGAEYERFICPKPPKGCGGNLSKLPAERIN